MRKRLLPAGLLLVLASATAARAADDGWRVSGSMRVRYETLDGEARAGFNPGDTLVSLRTTALAEYRTGGFRIGGEIYDSRTWGGDRKTPISTNDVNALEPVQAYVGWTGRTEALGPVSAEAGRFTLNFGSRRLVASDDYRNTTNTYEGVQADLAPGGVRTSLIYVRPVVRLPDGIDDVLHNRQHIDHTSSDVQLWGGLMAKPRALGAATAELTYLHFQERDAPGRPTRDRSLDSFGGRLLLDPRPGQWDYEVEAIVQTGEISRGLAPTDRKQDVMAGMLRASLGHGLPGAWSPHLTGILDVVTGDRGGARYGRFDTLYGMRRNDFSPGGIYAVVGRANMISPGLRLEVTPSKTWDAMTSLRGLWLESRTDAFSNSGVRDATGRSGDYAGTQLDARVRYWLVKDRLRAEVDGDWLAKGRFLQHAPNAPKSGSSEHYLSLNLTALY